MIKKWKDLIIEVLEFEGDCLSLDSIANRIVDEYGKYGVIKNNKLKKNIRDCIRTSLIGYICSNSTHGPKIFFQNKNKTYGLVCWLNSINNLFNLREGEEICKKCNGLLGWCNTCYGKGRVLWIDNLIGK